MVLHDNSLGILCALARSAPQVRKLPLNAVREFAQKPPKGQNPHLASSSILSLERAGRSLLAGKKKRVSALALFFFKVMFKFWDEITTLPLRKKAIFICPHFRASISACS